MAEVGRGEAASPGLDGGAVCATVATGIVQCSLQCGWCGGYAGDAPAPCGSRWRSSGDGGRILLWIQQWI